MRLCTNRCIYSDAIGSDAMMFVQTVYQPMYVNRCGHICCFPICTKAIAVYQPIHSFPCDVVRLVQIRLFERCARTCKPIRMPCTGSNSDAMHGVRFDDVCKNRTVRKSRPGYNPMYVIRCDAVHLVQCGGLCRLVSVPTDACVPMQGCA